MHLSHPEIRPLLQKAYEILYAQGERNWIRAFANALAELDGGNMEGARSIYLSMIAGGHGFSEYNAWLDDYSERAEANRELDDVKERLRKVSLRSNIDSVLIRGQELLSHPAIESSIRREDFPLSGTSLRLRDAESRLHPILTSPSLSPAPIGIDGGLRTHAYVHDPIR